MKEIISYYGTDFAKFKDTFLEFFDENYLLEIFDVIDKYKDEFLSVEEDFEISSDKDTHRTLGYNKLIPSTHYHVRLRGVSIVCLQIFGEMIIQAIIQRQDIGQREIPIIPSIIELKKCFNKLSEENGELCLCKEIDCKRGKFIGWEDFMNGRNECINNFLNCLFNENGNCKLKKNKFEEILNELIQKSIVYKDNEGYKITR